MKDQFKRILELVKRTGDTLIVTDSDGENAYVVMDLDQYELFIDAPFSKTKSAEEQLWEEAEFIPDPAPEPVPEPEQALAPEPDAVIGHDMDGDGIPDIWDVMQSAQENGPTWNPEQLSADELADLERQYEAFAKRHVQQAIEETVPEVVDPVPAPPVSEPVEVPEQPVEQPTEQSSEPVNSVDSASDDEFGEEQFYLEPIE